MTSVDASDPTGLGFREDGAGDPAAIEAAAESVAALLDAHLDAVQRGTATGLATLGGDWVAGESPAAAALLTSGLANPETPIAAARYDLVVHVEAEPTTVVAQVEATRTDGSLATVTLVFSVTGDAPLLTVVDDNEDA